MAHLWRKKRIRATFSLFQFPFLYWFQLLYWVTRSKLGWFYKRIVSRGSFVSSGSICWNQKFPLCGNGCGSFSLFSPYYKLQGIQWSIFERKGGALFFFFLFPFSFLGLRPQQIISSFHVPFWRIALSKHILHTFVFLSFGLIWSWLLLRSLGPWHMGFFWFIIYPFSGGVTDTICVWNGASWEKGDV